MPTLVTLVDPDGCDGRDTCRVCIESGICMPYFVIAFLTAEGPSPHFPLFTLTLKECFLEPTGEAIPLPKSVRIVARR